MVSAPTQLRLGTRTSALARWQTNHVAALLLAAWPHLHITVVEFHTHGDKVLDTPLPLLGGKGVFTAELERALHDGSIDLAVHSLKDLPTGMQPGLTIGAIPPRADAHDVLISRAGRTLEELPDDATLGTSSVRRAGQLRRRYPRLRLVDIRGNVDTRIHKALAADGPYDAIILAQAGVERLGRSELIVQMLPFELMLPAPGQGALALQCRAEPTLLELLTPLDDAFSRAAVTAERAFLQGLGGGCAAPIAAYAQCAEGRLLACGRITARDGAEQIDVALDGPLDAAAELGAELARLALAQGAARLIEGSR